MATKRELPRTPLALAVMNLLMEHPMHPYEMKAKMKERGHDQVIKIKGGSIYDTVERLEQGGFIRAQETSRDGRRPEKTVYAITEVGREEILAWLRELLAQPVNEYPQFGAALAFFACLDKDEVVRLLRLRLALLEGQAAGDEKFLKSFMGMGLPRLFLVEGEYAVAMKRAELEWVRSLIRDIEGGSLWFTKEQMRAAAQSDTQWFTKEQIKAMEETIQMREKGGETDE
ncbi:MAG TPA: PadR family transcriptional regulator [Candidatus Acidoferrum sp.]|nr:PadR family transcriptional regulator [Candidatus Acidoferrum sp.]